MSRSWIAIASADHVRRGRAGGFMQVCHGKGGPIRRLRAGDRVVYYSPTVSMGGKDSLQAFTSIGIVEDKPVYQSDMGGGFRPFRRDVNYAGANEAAILPLLEQLDDPRQAQLGLSVQAGTGRDHGARFRYDRGRHEGKDPSLAHRT
jgi:EVE domain-containing protein